MRDEEVLEDRLEELAALWGATSDDELRRSLVLGSPVLGESHDAFEPLCLFRKAHKGQPEGAAQTALLLLTDWRWRRATSRLVRAIDESGLVPEVHLDLLARAFLAAGEALYWRVPTEWFDGPEITLPTPVGAGHRGGDVEDDAPVAIARRVQPPVRRWAAARLVRSKPPAWAEVVRRAREPDARAGAAVMAGLVDAVEVLRPAAQEAVIGLALDWGARSVRLAALEHLAAHGQSARAGASARKDPDAALRRWAQQLAQRPPLASESTDGPTVGSSLGLAAEPTLF